MGIGREIGNQLHQWVNSGELNNLPRQALVNRLIDAAGASRRLHGPLQDLGRQPLFLQLLGEQQQAKARATLQVLTAELGEIYSPGILTELVQRLEAAMLGLISAGQGGGREIYHRGLELLMAHKLHYPNWSSEILFHSAF